MTIFQEYFKYTPNNIWEPESVISDVFVLCH